ncbi:MAG: hypothetical protein U5N86_08095 [Planctomycetota bacterium]|nr:hypothetical protein [Planctomycetota bacterium]
MQFVALSAAAAEQIRLDVTDQRIAAQAAEKAYMVGIERCKFQSGPQRERAEREGWAKGRSLAENQFLLFEPYKFHLLYVLDT